MKPLLKWAGGKATLAPRIATALGNPASWAGYREPFLGSGAVFLHLRSTGYRGPAVLSDVSARLIGFHRAVRDHVDAVLQELDALPTVPGWQAQYPYLRDRFNVTEPHGPRFAALFLWINGACFNGLYRENRSGNFNVPVGRYERISLPSPDHIRLVSSALKGAELEVADFAPSLLLALEDDAVYCDPPYLPASATSSFTAYSGNGFGLEEQRRLAAHAAASPARVVLSNADIGLVDKLYPSAEFAIERFSVRRSISVGKRGSAQEVLITRRSRAREAA